LEQRIGKAHYEPTNATATRNFLADAMFEGHVTYRIAEDPADRLADCDDIAPFGALTHKGTAAQAEESRGGVTKSRQSRVRLSC
jgi:hypothetical protein